MTAALRIAAVVVLQTLALGWMIADRFWLLETGREAVFKVIPVDPRDFFRGDYVILSFPFSVVEPDKLGSGKLDLERGDTVFVTLAPDPDMGWRTAAVSRTEPASVTDDQLLLRGTVDSAYQSVFPAENLPLPPECPNGCPRVTVSYGVESFFVPYGKGHAIEEERNRDKVEAVVRVDSGGRAGIKALRVAGETVYSETLF